jgi:hypothetical protein
VYGFLDDAANDDKPFFLVAAPNAPHSNVAWNGKDLNHGGEFAFTAPIPADRHKDLFPDAIVPRTDSFNPKEVCVGLPF